jgi:hypothetical protein
MATISQQPNFQTVRLAPGRHESPGREVCLMELSSMLAGERFSDHPRSVCPVLAGIFRAYNDWLDDTRRKDLYGFASRAVGTRGGHPLEVGRGEMAIAWGQSEYLRRRRRRFSLRRKPRPPRPDDAPDEIGSFIIDALGRRLRDDAHLRMLALLDELIEFSPTPHTTPASERSAELVSSTAGLAIGTASELTHEYMLPPACDGEREQFGAYASDAQQALEEPVIHEPVLRTRRRVPSLHPFADFASSAAF